MVKSTDCLWRAPKCNSQQPHGGSQPSVMGCPLLVCLKTETVFSHISNINKSLQIIAYNFSLVYFFLLGLLPSVDSFVCKIFINVLSM